MGEVAEYHLFVLKEKLFSELYAEIERMEPVFQRPSWRSSFCCPAAGPRRRPRCQIAGVYFSAKNAKSLRLYFLWLWPPAPPSPPAVHCILRRLEVTQLQHSLVMFDGFFFVDSAHMNDAAAPSSSCSSFTSGLAKFLSACSPRNRQGTRTTAP